MCNGNTVFLWLKDAVVFLPKQSKNLDLSYKTDLDLWNCLGRFKLIKNFHRTDLVFCNYSREGETQSCSPINTAVVQQLLIVYGPCSCATADVNFGIITVTRMAQLEANYNHYTLRLAVWHTANLSV